MSYCRWSSDDYQCDVYVYESDRGFETHVARRRRVFDAPVPPVPADEGGVIDLMAHIRRHAAVMLLPSHYEQIELPGAGKSFTHATPGECADNLERLRSIGFNVPQYAIDGLRAEQAEAPVGDSGVGA